MEHYEAWRQTKHSRSVGSTQSGRPISRVPGEVKPSELVEWGYERAAALNPSLNAIVIPIPNQQAGDVSLDVTFPGVPFLVKDLVVEIPGTEITEGSRYLAGVVSEFESELAARHRRAGLVTIGKTHSPEFGMAPFCETDLYGVTRNPWNVEHTTAGSSGGAAAAVAAGIVPMAHASDAGGSIRYPASCCGLFGLKPTRGA